MGLGKHLIKTGIFATGSAFLLNEGIDRLAAIRGLLSKDGGTFYSWDNTEVFYTKAGEGSPLLLLHDLRSDSCGYEWSRVAEKLSESYTVYTVDLPGCGRSQKPGVQYTAYYYLLFLKSFISDVIKEPVAVMASGASCCFAILAAADEETEIRALTLVNPPSPAQLSRTPDKKDKLFWKMLAVPVLGTFSYNMICSFTAVKDTLEKDFSDETNCSKVMIDTFYEASHAGASNGKFLYASRRGGYLNLPIEQAFGSLHISIKIILGEENVSRQSTEKFYAAHNDGISLSVVENTKTFPHLEQPALFQNAL